MNQLSWMLYFANVCANLGNLFAIIFVISLIVFGISLFVGLAMADGCAEAESWKKWRQVLFGSIVAAFLTFIVSSFVPTKDTVYAIAASQLGEQVLKTPLANKAEQAVEAWLDKQLVKKND